MEQALVEIGFMMFVLKLPIVYLFGVVWWAVRASEPPTDELPVAPVEPPCPWDRRRRRPPTPRGGSPRARAAARTRVSA
ncbi:MAG TPA: hypothetical protein VM290_03515 [Gaiellaceae bacterium]|jgi:hypothetical protein|nr:hypothetical protein [Gaiellaceae bacterium]